MSAAMAPSVAAIGATTPIWPTRSPAYMATRPETAPRPPAAAHAPDAASRASGRPVARASGVMMTTPTSITQATPA